MERIPEPELMEAAEQALAYAAADFAEPHDRFVALFRERFPQFGDGQVLDLGCGPADVTVRFAHALPGVRIDGIDGAQAMLDHGQARVQADGLEQRIRLCHGYLPLATLPNSGYDAIISNSLLHHLADPLVLWRTVRQASRPGTLLFVMDLLRPASRAEAEALVAQYAADEPEVLRHDFFYSLLAAYRIAEVVAQLDAAGLPGLTVEAVSDRHLIVYGLLS